MRIGDRLRTLPVPSPMVIVTAGDAESCSCDDGTERTSPQDWDQAIPKVLAEIGRRRIPKRRHRTSPRALNASATTATASRNAARPAAPATPAQPPSESTPSNHEQPDCELRYVALGSGSNALTAFRNAGASKSQRCGASCHALWLLRGG
jgi:hypothetical protein